MQLLTQRMREVLLAADLEAGTVHREIWRIVRGVAAGATLSVCVLLPALSTSATALSPGPIAILFAFDSATLDVKGQKVMDWVLLEAIERGTEESPVHFAVTGYADRAGPEDYNMVLSWRRAEAVRDALIARGISADRITIVGRGEAEPRVRTADGVPKAENRFVEIGLQ